MAICERSSLSPTRNDAPSCHMPWIAEPLLVVLPIVDRAALAALPALPPGLVKRVVVCNAGDAGHLAATAIARAAGHPRVSIAVAGGVVFV